MSISRRNLIKATAAVGALALPGARYTARTFAQSIQYELIEITTFPESIQVGGNPLFGQVRAFNAVGQIGGTLIENGLAVPAIWAADGSVTRLDAGPSGARLLGMNDEGVAVGEMFTGDPSAGKTGIPVYWREGAIFACPMPAELAGEDQQGAATGINNSGVISGWTGGGRFTVRWTNDIGQVMPAVMDGLYPGFHSGYAISSNGTIGGWAAEQTDQGFGFLPFLWNPETPEEVTFPEFPPSSKTGNWGVSGLLGDDSMSGISDTGDFTVSFQRDGDSYPSVLQYRASNPVELDELPGSDGSYARSVNANGQVVGCAVQGNFADLDWRAVIWTNGVPVDLNDLLAEPTELLLTQGLAINDQGEIAVRATDTDGVRHLVVLRPVS